MGLGELLRDSPEQFAVFQAAGKHQSIVVEASAGTGKTTTLGACGEKLTLENKKVLYLAFNREIVQETKGKAKALFDSMCQTQMQPFRDMRP
jgi:superfamily I DNA/RNA helicase